MNESPQTLERLHQRVQSVYGPLLSEVDLNSTLSRLDSILANASSQGSNATAGPDRSHSTAAANERWSEEDVVLITYADQVAAPEQATLASLRQFLLDHQIVQATNIVHLLPFYPYSSDDGFSVIDYYDLAPGVGTWEDLQDLNRDCDLMFDLVLNHCSQHSQWFKKFLLDDPDYRDFFHVVDPGLDLSAVTRPRSLPLLTEFETVVGEKFVWTTFSGDQVDLNFANPDVLIEFVQILLFYVSQGARIIRLDAVAFLWKEIGTSCIHLPQTHQVIKLLHDILELVAPHVILLTETNVPHDENVSYFGEQDEAHMVYQFSLPPLLVDMFVHEDPAPLRDWLMNLEFPPAGTTFFNFAASHDGIGVRPLEGLLSDTRFDSLIDAVKQRGGIVSTRRTPDGSDVPYELNISYIDAIVGAEESLDLETRKRKFLASQAIVLSLPGVPAIYFHSLVGTPNDQAAVSESGIPRRINRRKYQFDELQEILSDPCNLQHHVLTDFLQLIKVRKQIAAFHPEAACRVLDPRECENLGDARLLSIERTSRDGSESVHVIVNPTSQNVRLKLDPARAYTNPITGQAVDLANATISSYDFLWLVH